MIRSWLYVEYFSIFPLVLLKLIITTNIKALIQSLIVLLHININVYIEMEPAFIYGSQHAFFEALNYNYTFLQIVT